MISTRVLGLMLVAFGAAAQTWTGSGSTGADGAFDLTLAKYSVNIFNGVFVFDPVRDGLDASGTNVYNFTKVSIPNGVTVQVRANKLKTPGPVIWLSSGAVIISGVLDVSGNNGHDATVSLSARSPSQPGPAGFPGGAGAKAGDLPQRGFGPGGGIVPTTVGSSGCSAGFATAWIPDSYGNQPAAYYGPASRCAGGGSSYGNGSLQPFIGGSGGSGGYPNAVANLTGPGGGAGGGAIRITSDASITLDYAALGNVNANAHIYANGGNPGVYTVVGNSIIIGGAGSGGSIHLQAPAVNIGPRNGGDTMTANGGVATAQGDGNEYGSAGRIRVDTNNFFQANGVISPTPLVGPLVNVPLPTNQPTVTLVSINGTPVPVQPSGAYTVPDISVNNMGNIPVVIQTTNIPNTTINLYISTEPGTADSIVPVTLTNGTGSANITLPQGVSRFVVRATW